MASHVIHIPIARCRRCHKIVYYSGDMHRYQAMLTKELCLLPEGKSTDHDV